MVRFLFLVVFTLSIFNPLRAQDNVLNMQDICNQECGYPIEIGVLFPNQYDGDVLQVIFTSNRVVFQVHDWDSNKAWLAIVPYKKGVGGKNKGGTCTWLPFSQDPRELKCSVSVHGKLEQVISVQGLLQFIVLKPRYILKSAIGYEIHLEWSEVNTCLKPVKARAPGYGTPEPSKLDQNTRCDCFEWKLRAVKKLPEYVTDPNNSDLFPPRGSKVQFMSVPPHEIHLFGAKK